MAIAIKKDSIGNVKVRALNPIYLTSPHCYWTYWLIKEYEAGEN